MKFYLRYFLFFLPSILFAEQTKIDSLLTLLKKDKEDTNKVNHLNTLSREYIDIGSYDSSFAFANNALKLSPQLNPPYKKGIATTYNNLGVVYMQQADYPKALEYYFKGLKMAEDLGDKNKIASCLGNIGIIYNKQADHTKALEYYFKALKLFEELGNKNAITAALINIGNVYRSQADYTKALDYYFKGLKIAEEIGHKQWQANALSGIGIVYYEKADYPKALDYYFKSLKMQEELGDKNGIASSLGNIGNLYIQTRKFNEAEEYFKKSLVISYGINALALTRNQEQALSQLYDSTGHTKLAFEHYKKYITARDSIANDEKKKKQMRTEMNYEFEKKEAIIKAEHDAKTKQQKIIIWSVIGGLLLVGVFSVFMFNRWRITQRQKTIIEKQKHIVDEQKKLVEEKNKDITDSINYAQRIQKALLASNSLLNRNLGEHFVLFKPKDIVSGDFYWATEKDGRFYLAVCDSTGHGVPGAFMSLLNISFLNEAIAEKGIKQPNEVFNHVRQRLIENISTDGAKDGMDGILVCFDKSKKEISYAGANNAPMLMNEALQELPTDNMPVGLGEKKDSFTHQTISFQSGNILYLYTDGFADQFGGPKGKKFKYKPLNEKLSAISNQPLAKQKEELEKTFIDWKGNLEQVDDVLVIGIKI